MQRRWPEAEYREDKAFTDSYVNCLATIGQEQPPSQTKIKLALYGTPFQLQVWQALLQIPFGQRTTYQNIAQSIGSPNAARAVGTTIGNNPVAWLIPCHRVIRRDGGYGGYHWGEGRKLGLLGWESAQAG